MELKHLQYFTEVVKHGSFSKAAKSLYISQPNISNVIKGLEEELEVKLLIRTTRSLELTDIGKLLFQYGQQVSKTLQQFYQELEDTKNSKKGCVKMGIFPMIGTNFFTKMISEFHKKYPEISVQFVEDGASHLKKALIQGELDLAVMPYPIDEGLFNFFPFLKGDLRVLVHQHHPLANNESVKWSELHDENFIIFREGFTIHDTIMDECGRLGFEPNIICETSQWNFMMEMVLINQGITILPQSKFNEIDHNNLNLKILPLVEPEKNWNLGIAWIKGGYLSFATRTWIQFIKGTSER